MGYELGILVGLMILVGIHFVGAEKAPYPHIVRGSILQQQNVSGNESLVVDGESSFVSKSFLLYLCIALLVSIFVLLFVIYYFYGGFK